MSVFLFIFRPIKIFCNCTLLSAKDTRAAKEDRLNIVLIFFPIDGMKDWRCARSHWIVSDCSITKCSSVRSDITWMGYTCVERPLCIPRDRGMRDSLHISNWKASKNVTSNEEERSRSVRSLYIFIQNAQ